MIKFIATALLAILIAGHVSAEDEASQEVSLLMGNAKVFTNFCVNERAAIKADIKMRVQQKSSQVYQLFFNHFVVEIADEVMDVTREQVEKYTQRIVAPEKLKSAPSGPIPEEEIEKRLKETTQVLEQAQSSLFGRVRDATTSVAEIITRTAKSAFYIRLAKLRAVMGQQAFLQSLVDACQQVKDYEAKLQRDLGVEKERLLQNYDQPELQRFIQGMEVKTLQCQITRAISRTSGFCTVIISGTKPLLKALGYTTQIEFPAPSVAENMV